MGQNAGTSCLLAVTPCQATGPSPGQGPRPAPRPLGCSSGFQTSTYLLQCRVWCGGGLSLGLYRSSALLQEALLNLLLLLQRLHEGGLQPACVLHFECLLLVGCHAVLTHDGPALLLPPAACEVRLALRTHVGLPGQYNSCRHPARCRETSGLTSKEQDAS